MPQRIEIEGGIQRAIEYTIISELPLASVLAHVERTPRIVTPIIPRSAILFASSTNENNETHVSTLLELPPATRQVTFRGRDMVERAHRLMLPWTYFHFTLTSNDTTRNVNWMIEMHRSYWSRARVTDLASARFLIPSLPNVYEDGRICFGSTAPDSSMPLCERLDQIVNDFYSSQFNRDLTIRYPNGFRRLADWAEATAANPTGWMQWPDWIQARPATELLDEALTDTQPIVIDGLIPAYAAGMTFGSSEDWLRRLRPNDRIRLRTGFDSIAIDTPELMTPTPTTGTTDAED